ncbi:hypothetical protein AALC16_05840 [Lachnospiraceae bacterium 29-91]
MVQDCYLWHLVFLRWSTTVIEQNLRNGRGVRAAGAVFGGAAVLSCLTLAISGTALPSVCGILALRVSNSLFQPLQAEMQNQQVHTEYRATALSIHAMLLDGIGAGTNLAFGVLAERNLAAAFLFGVGICGAGTGLFLKWCRNRNVCYDSRLNRP